MFNPEARWDRNLPQENNESESLNEAIIMVCLFDKSKPLPRYFRWRNYLYKVKKVNFFWQQRQGRETLSYFSLETNSGTYQVSFSNISLCWKMDRIIDI